MGLRRKVYYKQIWIDTKIKHVLSFSMLRFFTKYNEMWVGSFWFSFFFSFVCMCVFNSAIK